MVQKKVFLVEKDEDAIEIATQNLKLLEEKFGKSFEKKVIFVLGYVESLDEKVDIVIENPPFGIQSMKHADKVFLEKAMAIAPVIFTIHKVESKQFMEALCKDHDFEITHFWPYEFGLKQQYSHHTRRMEYIQVGCWRLEKF